MSTVRRCQFGLRFQHSWSPHEVTVTLLLLCSGDVERNPGPRYPCSVCGKAVTARQQGIEFSKCEQWTHARCAGISQRCVTEQAPQCMSERMKTNRNIGNHVTRGHSKLFVPRAIPKFYRKSFTFKGIQEWNSLPLEIRNLNSVPVFRRRLRALMINR